MKYIQWYSICTLESYTLMKADFCPCEEGKERDTIDFSVVGAQRGKPNFSAVGVRLNTFCQTTNFNR